MSNMMLDEARLYLSNSLKGKRNAVESRHPWRRGWEFAVLHSLRVESYAMKILSHEGQHPLSEHQILLLRLAAILHDIARLEKREGHALLGAEIAKNWLREHSGNPLSKGDIDRVADLIEDHSNKQIREQDFSKAVLKDADTLDEIGAMSVLMAGNWVEPQSPFFFSDLRQRLIDFEVPFCENKLAILNTHGAREILHQKKAFIETFIAQITEEIEMEVPTEQLLR